MGLCRYKRHRPILSSLPIRIRCEMQRERLHSLLCGLSREEERLELFPCCWVSRNSCAAAFSLRKTLMKVAALDYTQREMLYAPAKSAIGFSLMDGRFATAFS